MRTTRGLLMIALALLLLGGSALAQGGDRGFAVYLPLVPVPPSATAGPPAPATPGPTSTPTSTPTSSPVPQVYDGVWSGTTGQQREIGFTIVDNQFTTATLSYRVGGCGATLRTFYGTVKPRVTDGAFTLVESSVQVLPGGGIFYVTITVRGTFTSASAASGTLAVSGTACGGAETTWTATRGGTGQAPTPPPTSSPTATSSPTPTATGEAASAGVSIENLTGGPLSITLSGPTSLSTTVAHGEEPRLAVIPGTYVLTATASCGTQTDVFSVAAGRTVGYSYRCVAGPAGVAVDSQSNNQ